MSVSRIKAVAQAHMRHLDQESAEQDHKALRWYFFGVGGNSRALSFFARAAVLASAFWCAFVVLMSGATVLSDVWALWGMGWSSVEASEQLLRQMTAEDYIGRLLGDLGTHALFDAYMAAFAALYVEIGLVTVRARRSMPPEH